MNSSNSNISSKYNLPKFRVSSYGSDVNGNSTSNSFQNVSYILPNRTVSSSSTMILTPSNRRRVNHSQAIKKQDLNGKLSKNGRLIKSKLLNLHQSLKVITSLIDDNHHFNMANDKYDYSIFATFPNGENSSAPSIKQSQINAWESAETVSKNLIFNESDAEESDEEVDRENISCDQNINISPHQSPHNSPKSHVGSGVHVDNLVSSGNWISQAIKSIPGYSKGELDIILKSYCENLGDEDQKQLIYEYKKNLQKHQEKLFNQSTSLQLKRQIQVNQKKNLLRQLFGYLNNLNQNYITNNTAYSSIDNVKNIQKMFHEDKEEINTLIYEKQQFDSQLQLINSQHVPFDETLRKKRSKRSDNDMDDSSRLQLMAARNLDEIYDTHLSNFDKGFDEIDLEVNTGQDELQQMLTKNLRRYIKDNDE